MTTEGDLYGQKTNESRNIYMSRFFFLIPSTVLILTRVGVYCENWKSCAVKHKKNGSKGKYFRLYVMDLFSSPLILRQFHKNFIFRRRFFNSLICSGRFRTIKWMGNFFVIQKSFYNNKIYNAKECNSIFRISFLDFHIWSAGILDNFHFWEILFLPKDSLL